MDSATTHTCAPMHTTPPTHTNTAIIIQKKEDINLSWGQEWIIYKGLEERAG